MRNIVHIGLDAVQTLSGAVAYVLSKSQRLKSSVYRSVCVCVV